MWCVCVGGGRGFQQCIQAIPCEPMSVQAGLCKPVVLWCFPKRGLLGQWSDCVGVGVGVGLLCGGGVSGINGILGKINLKCSFIHGWQC